MEPMKLSFGVLIVYLNQVILQMKDPRLASNGTKYTITDAVMGAFSMFFMQSESFLEHQRHMKSNQGKSNAQTLFGMIKIPTVPQIRNILDEIPATAIFGVFNQVYQSLRREGHLKPFEYLGGLLVALDGTQYFDSHKLNCKCRPLPHPQKWHNNLLPQCNFACNSCAWTISSNFPSTRIHHTSRWTPEAGL